MIVLNAKNVLKWRFVIDAEILKIVKTQIDYNVVQIVNSVVIVNNVIIVYAV